MKETGTIRLIPSGWTKEVMRRIMDVGYWGGIGKGRILNSRGERK
jgi:hypothetical protein